jgi:hypothetical protein
MGSCKSGGKGGGIVKAQNKALNIAKDFIKKNSVSPNAQPTGLSLKVGDKVDSTTIDFKILSQNLNEGERYAVGLEFFGTVKRETEKAVLVKWNTEYGTVQSWFPKSAIGKPQTASKGLLYNGALKEYARSLGVKGITNGNMKTDTIKNKIKSAGYKVPEYKDFDL